MKKEYICPPGKKSKVVIENINFKIKEGATLIIGLAGIGLLGPIVGNILGVEAYEDTIIAYSERTIYIIDDKGYILIEKKINKDIQDVFWISQGNFVVVFKDRMEIMTLNY